MKKNFKLNTEEKMSTNNLVKASLLVAISFLLSFIRFPIPLLGFPPYLKLDIAELPALIGAFALGPLMGVAVVFVRNVLDFLIKSSTGGVGELSNFIVGSSFVLTSSLIYYFKKSKKRAVIGVICGTLVMTVTALFSNKYLIFPLYGLPADWSFLFTFILPFNLIKGGINSVAAILVYKKLSGFLKQNII